MSTCPEIDIHSLYLDNELPQKFKTDYEVHIKSCNKCQAQLESLKKTRQLFALDAKSLDVDKVFLDQSFERLQNRMRFSKIVKQSSKQNILFTNTKKCIPIVAAAAAVFAIMLPAKVKAPQEQMVVAQVQPIKRTTNFSFDHNELLTQASYATYPINLMPIETESIDVSNFALNSFLPCFDTNVQNAYSINANAYQKKSSKASKLLQEDFFSPDFIHSGTQVYMPIYVDISALNK